MTETDAGIGFLCILSAEKAAEYSHAAGVDDRLLQLCLHLIDEAIGRGEFHALLDFEEFLAVNDETEVFLRQMCARGYRCYRKRDGTGIYVGWGNRSLSMDVRRVQEKIANR